VSLTPLLNTQPAPTHHKREQRALLTLIGCAVLIEALLIFGWVRPLSLWRTPTNLYAGAPMVPILGDGRWGAAQFAVPALLLIAAWTLALCSARALRGRRALWLVAGVGVVLLVTLVPINPAGTQDIYHNVADGRLFWLHGVNPTVVPPIAFPEDAFARHVWGYADLPSAYGPLWYEISGLPVLIAGDALIPNLLAQKLLVSLFTVGTFAVVALAAHRAAPRRAIAAVVLIGWCPLVLWESAGNGHNDVLMTFFLAASLFAAVRRAYVWVLPLLMLSVLVKYTTALAVPVALVWLWRRPDVSYRDVLYGCLLAALVMLVSFAPLYAGWDTVAALRRPGMTFILSPATLLDGALAAWWPEERVARLIRFGSATLFAVAYVVVLRHTGGDARDLAARTFDVLFLYLVLASWWFWPWYVLWLAPGAALARGWARPAAFAMMAAGALLTYLYWWPDPMWRSERWFIAYGTIVTVVFALPAVVWLRGLRSPIDHGGTAAANPSAAEHATALRPRHG